jgi:hypothetical protein
VKVNEGELEFSFTGAVSVTKLDIQRMALPHGMALVDFVVEESARLLLVEVKDPSQKPVPVAEQIKFAKKMQNNELIHQELTPKVRDSYCFLHLMEKDKHPLIFVVVLGLEAVTHDPALLVTFKDRLLQRIRQETDAPWKKHYVKDCVIIKVADWATYFPNYVLRRIP